MRRSAWLLLGSLAVAGCAASTSVVQFRGASQVDKKVRHKWKPSVFVSGGQYVQQFAPKNGGKLLQTYDLAPDAYGLNADPSSNLVVALFQKGILETFAPNQTQPSLQIGLGQDNYLESVAVCQNGNAYLSYNAAPLHSPGALEVYSESTQQFFGPLDEPNVQESGYVQCDPSSNVFAVYIDTSNDAHFVEYYGGQGQPQTVNLPVPPFGFRFDASDDLVVANRATVDFYKVGQKSQKPFRSITGFNTAVALAFERGDTTMWVADAGLPQIDEVDVASGTIVGKIAVKTSGVYDVFVFPSDQFAP